ncbi:hypothetical protein KSF73_12365 [Burkholderiaceae bacterium DAT-1]|nr:hypothetical protein [Burkholderiaceae bacterium DAT-1]
MNPSQLVSQLTRPLSELNTTEFSAKQVVIAALTWPTDGWAKMALNWLEEGIELDNEIADALEAFASTKRNSQAIRHKAFSLAKQWRNNLEART